MMTFPCVKAHPRGVACPTHGKLEEVVVKAYTSNNGHDELHLRAACPTCDQWVKFADKPGPWYPSRHLVGLTKRDGYYKGVSK